MDRRNIVSVMVPPVGVSSGRPRALLRAAVGCALALAVTGGGGPAGSSVSMAHEPSPSRGGAVGGPAAGGATYTLLQTNLCLSGFAGCYGKVAYPNGVEE